MGPITPSAPLLSLILKVNVLCGIYWTSLTLHRTRTSTPALAYRKKVTSALLDKLFELVDVVV